MYFFVCESCNRSMVIAQIEDSSDSSDRDGDDNSEYSPDRSSGQHHDEDEYGGEVEGFAHHFWHEKIILYLLDDDIEDRDDGCDFPRYPESDDERWDQCYDRSNIGNEFHNSSYHRESECSLGIEPKYHLEGEESNIGDSKYRKGEHEHCLHPCSGHVLYLMIVLMEVGIYISR